MTALMTDKNVMIQLHSRYGAFHCWELCLDEVKVADIRESMVKNKKLPLVESVNNSLRPPPVLDLRVAEGFDLSLVRLLFRICWIRLTSVGCAGCCDRVGHVF